MYYIMLFFIIAVCLLSGFIAGISVGMIYENKHGHTAQSRDRYYKIILKMIPYLKEHYTNEFIYCELMRKQEGEHSGHKKEDSNT